MGRIQNWSLKTDGPKFVLYFALLWALFAFVIEPLVEDLWPEFGSSLLVTVVLVALVILFWIIIARNVRKSTSPE
jgi:hypothetical protein